MSAPFTERVVPRYPTAPSQETRPAAEAEPLPASAAFSSFAEASEDKSHFTESSFALRASEDRSSFALRASAFAEATADVSEDWSHFTESCPVSPPVDGQDLTAPAPPAKECAGAVALSEASAFILSLIAAHEGRSERDIIAGLITAAGYAIGLSPLLQRDAADIVDMADVPDFARAAANRFRGGGP